MSDLLSMQVLLWVGESFAASSLIVALAWLAAARNTASQRHLVWFASFVALAALPVLALIVPAQITYMLAGPVIPVTQGFDTTAIASLPEPSGFTFDTATVVEMLIALWLLGVVLIAVRGLVAAFALYNMRRNSVPHRFGHLPIDGPRCDLRLAQEDCGPMTWGIFRPVILLPGEAETWPHSRLEAVLLHELAHVRRKDSLTQLASLAVCALYWPNPLVWLAAARLRREAETAADDAVLIAGVRPSDYAGELLQIASEFRVQRLSLPLAMAAPSALEARVKSVLEPNKSRSGVTYMDVFKIACLGMMATTAIAFARPSLAQDAPQVQSAPLPPPTPNAPPAPPATEAMPALAPLPPTPPIDAIHADRDRTIVIDTDENGTHRHIVRHWSDLTPAERARIHAQVQAAMAKAKPEIDRAMREVARTRPQVEASMREVEAARPQIEAAMRQVEASRPQIEAAMAEAMRSTHQINEAQIQAALAKARVALAKLPNEAVLNAQVQRAMAKAQAQLAAARVHMHDHATIIEDDSNAEGPDADDDDAAPPAPPVPPAPEAAPPAPPAPPVPQN
jgi:beta-lactamase regulating signal transducer with metallopeptidase domain